MTIAERHQALDDFLAQPETEPASEYYPDGTVVQKVAPQGKHSVLRQGCIEMLNSYARPARLALALMELRTTYHGASLVPDIAVYRWDRIPRDPNGTIANRFVEAPDIAIEIVSPDQRLTPLVRKCLWYVENGTQVALIVDPEDESVLEFRPGGKSVARSRGDVIEFGDLLPGFKLGVDQLFDTLKLD